ncbi:MAG: type II secretion system F family protein [Dactylosporangium sp.]|nr:type II secretion system F family protein [Dactylosporangium sp.]NNJ63156.1 type II secretion system F family protein [Dactylosporangium sp.]
MAGTALMYAGLGLLIVAAVVGSLASIGESAERVGVAKSIATIERSYGSVSKTVIPGAVDPQASLKERIGLPMAERLGSLGRTLTPDGMRQRLERQLDYAGNPAGWPVERVVASKGVGLVVGIVGGLLLGAMLGGFSKILLGGILGALLGFFMPDLMIYNTGAKRQDEMRKSLPDVLDTLTICVEAGQGFDAALAQVSRNGRGPMVGETARVLQEMRIGKSRVDAMRSLSARTTIEELRGFASAVVQASELGVPIGNVLREQSREMRVRRRQRAEEQAQKVPIKILFPTLFCLFPTLFIVIIGPGVLSFLGQ